MPIISCIETGVDSIDNCPQGVETGIYEELFIAQTAHLIASPLPATRTATTSAADWLLASGTFTFKPGKAFSRFETTKSPAYDDDIDGEAGSKGIKAKLSAMLQRTPDAMGLRAKNKNANLVVVFKDGDGRWCMLGYKGKSAKLVKAPSNLDESKASLQLDFESLTEAYYLPANFTPQITLEPQGA